MMKVAVFYAVDDVPEHKLLADLEARDIQAVVEAINPRQVELSQYPCTTVPIFQARITQATFDMIHITSHGSAAHDGLTFSTESGDTIQTGALAQLLAVAQPDLRCLILNTCNSYNLVQQLLPTAKWIISVSGEAASKACVVFSRSLYEHLARGEQLEQAYALAIQSINVLGWSAQIQLHLHPGQTRNGRLFVEAYLVSLRRTVRIDVTEVKDALNRVNDLGALLDSLGRKIALHRWIFEDAGYRQVLTFAGYCGFFSWKDGADIVLCDELRELDESNIDAKTMTNVFELHTVYLRIKSSRYRGNGTFFPQLGAQTIIRDFHQADDLAKELATRAPKLLKGMPVLVNQASALVQQVDYLIGDGRPEEVAALLDQAVSTWHEILIAAFRLFSTPVGEVVE